MPRKADSLFPRIASFRTLYEAALRAVRGKRKKPGAAAFMAHLETELLRLERGLLDGTWRPGRYASFVVEEPKPRSISAAPFCDRVVHHALCSVVEPIFERGFIANTYANRVGKGSHRAVACYERYRDRCRYVLRPALPSRGQRAAFSQPVVLAARLLTRRNGQGSRSGAAC